MVMSLQGFLWWPWAGPGVQGWLQVLCPVALYQQVLKQQWVSPHPGPHLAFLVGAALRWEQNSHPLPKPGLSGGGW